jgi:PAS domain S-box-containing protein
MSFKARNWFLTVSSVFVLLFSTSDFQKVFAQKDKSSYSGDPIVSQTEDRIVKQSADLQVKLLSANNRTEEQKIYKFMFLFSGIFFLLVGLLVSYLLLIRTKKLSVLLLQQERELKINILQREQLSLILDHVGNAVIIASPEGKINWVNEGFGKLYGFSVEDLIKSEKDNIKTFIGDENDRIYIEKCIAAKSEIEYSGETPDKSGKKIRFRRNLFPILDSQKNIISLVVADTELISNV